MFERNSEADRRTKKLCPANGIIKDSNKVTV